MQLNSLLKVCAFSKDLVINPFYTVFSIALPVHVITAELSNLLKDIRIDHFLIEQVNFVPLLFKVVHLLFKFLELLHVSFTL